MDPWRSPAPGFQVLTSSGRDPGLITGTSAAMIEQALPECITPRVSAAISSAAARAQTTLQLFLDVMMWFTPGDQRGTLL